MGYDVTFNGLLNFPDHTAMTQALQAVNHSDTFARHQFESMGDLLNEAFAPGDGVNERGPYGFGLTGCNRWRSEMDEVLGHIAPYVTEDSRVDWTGEGDGDFWRTRYQDGCLVEDPGFCTYVTDEGVTEEYAEGRDAALQVACDVLVAEAVTATEADRLTDLIADRLAPTRD